MKTRTGYTYYDEKRKSWVARFAPIDPTTGKRQNLKRYAGTKAEAARKLRKMVEEYEQKGTVSVDHSKMTVCVFRGNVNTDSGSSALSQVW